MKLYQLFEALDGPHDYWKKFESRGKPSMEKKEFGAQLFSRLTGKFHKGVVVHASNAQEAKRKLEDEYPMLTIGPISGPFKAKNESIEDIVADKTDHIKRIKPKKKTKTISRI